MVAPEKWTSLTACVITMIAAGTVYGFGIYSPQLKDGPAALTQRQLDWVSFAGNVGNYTPFPGLFYDAFGARASVFGASVASPAAPSLARLVMHRRSRRRSRRRRRRRRR